MTEFFKNKKVLVTGGAGSIGKELVKYILNFEDPDVVRIFDTNESEMFDFENELMENANIHNVRFLIGDVRDKDRLIRALDGIDYVFHTAAYKHVLSSEYNPFETVKTNVLGVQNVIEASLVNNVKKVIFTSSDKAVNAGNTMGATKLLGEKLMLAANYYSGKETAFSCVRFGNVMGSKGSVIPLFTRQIKDKRFITITNPDMTRFMMSKSEAVKLIINGMKLARGGEIFIFKMPVIRVSDLAECLIEGIAPDKKIEMKIIGNKPGETLYEELLTNHEIERIIEKDNMYVLLSEMKELFPRDLSIYDDAVKPKSVEYNSKYIEPISKEELKNILIKENLV